MYLGGSDEPDIAQAVHWAVGMGAVEEDEVVAEKRNDSAGLALSLSPPSDPLVAHGSFGAKMPAKVTIPSVEWRCPPNAPWMPMSPYMLTRYFFGSFTQYAAVLPN